jgi:hypothetical protein
MVYIAGACETGGFLHGFCESESGLCFLMCSDNLGESIIYLWVEHIREFLSSSNHSSGNHLVICIHALYYCVSAKDGAAEDSRDAHEEAEEDDDGEVDYSAIRAQLAAQEDMDMDRMPGAQS